MTVFSSKPVDGASSCLLEWGLIKNDLMCSMSCTEPPSDGLEGDLRPNDVPGGTSANRERRKLRNEDSSYDSDFDPCEPSSPRQEAHEDVSRTASETLGAEFAEYVTLQPTAMPPAPPSAQVSPHTMEAILACADYPQQVEFGVKLGYSESLVQLALLKLGLNPDKNKLLDELIRLGAGARKSDGDADEVEIEDKHETDSQQLRPIIIDGSNVAMSHGNNKTFSCKGIRLCVDWFQNRGHKHVVAFVPSFRKEASKVGSTISDQDVLYDLEKDGILSFTPSRIVGGKRIVPYDDRYILKEAVNTGGIVVSNDNYRDLLNDPSGFRKVIEESLLMYSWVNGRFEPPDDPLGRNGPSLDVFLKKTSQRTTAKDAKTCPYLRKCTYGNKCKYTHPERGTAPIKSVTERLQEQAQKHYQDKEKAKSRDPSPGEALCGKTLSLPVANESVSIAKKPLTRTQSNAPGGKYMRPSVKEPNMPSYDPMLGSIMSDSLFVAQKPPPAYGAPWTWSHEAQLSQRFPKQDGSDNPHPKLQRQLSINPVHDTRVNKKFLDPHFIAEQEHCGRTGVPNHYAPMPPYHTPLTRHSSSQESKSIPSFSHMYPYMHSNVTRNLSAPDAVWGDAHNPHRGHQSRLTSTSDSRLNTHVYGDPFEEPRHYLQAPANVGPVGSRPLSPHQLMQRPPQHLTQSTSLNPTVSKPYEDERFKIFYHLSQLFPEAQVRAALVGNPQETDPTKICASILNSGKTRSVSPQQMGSAFGTIGGHVPLRGSSSLGASFVDTQRETARMEAYSVLSKLFLEDQVRKILAAYPDETDSTKLCMLLVALNSST